MTGPGVNARARKVIVSTLGCKSNRYDSSAIEETLAAAGMELVELPGPADACIINTCTVTGKTDRQSRQLIRRVRRLNPGAVVIVTGCYAQVSPDEVGSIDGVDYVVGNPEKGRIIEYLERGRPASAVVSTGRWEDGTPFTLRAGGAGGRTRANLKVQEGCNRACSYCIIPRARGASKSLALGEVMRDIDSLVERGYKEIILTGIHLGSWGVDLTPKTGLASLLREIEARAYPCRFRISSLDPDEVSEELTELMGSAGSVCNHLHVALQSGDDGVIRAMARPYTAALFRERVEKAIEKIPGLCIGVDIMAGFPGEGAAEFENTFSLIEGLPLAYLHVFPFSKRRGTPAAGHSGTVNSTTIKQRCERLRALDARKRNDFYERFSGGVAEVLVETSRDKDTGLLKGRSRNYIPVLLEDDDSLMNTLVRVRLGTFTKAGMRGALEEQGGE